MFRLFSRPAICTSPMHDNSRAVLQAAAVREKERARAAAEAKRRAFEADEAALAAELEQRTQAERRILEEAAERARTALEQRRKCNTGLRSAQNLPCCYVNRQQV